MRLYMVTVFWDQKKICACLGRGLLSLLQPGQEQKGRGLLVLFPQSSDFRIWQASEKDVLAQCDLHPVVGRDREDVSLAYL